MTICGIQGALGRRRGLLVPTADHGCIDGGLHPGRRISGVVLLGGNADSGGVGLQPFAAEFADGGDGGFERLVPGFNRCTVAARGVDRARAPLMGLAISRPARRRVRKVFADEERF